MGAVRPARARAWRLQRTSNRPGELAARGVHRLDAKPGLRSDLLAKQCCSKRHRDRHGKGIRSVMGKGSLAWYLYLQSRNARYGRWTWLGISAFVYYPFVECGYCSAGKIRKVFRRPLPGTCSRGSLTKWRNPGRVRTMTPNVVILSEVEGPLLLA